MPERVTHHPHQSQPLSSEQHTDFFGLNDKALYLQWFYLALCQHPWVDSLYIPATIPQPVVSGTYNRVVQVHSRVASSKVSQPFMTFIS